MNKAQNHNLKTNLGKIFIPGYFALAIAFSSCNTARRVPQGEYLLTHNTVVYSSHAAKGKGIGGKITSLTSQQIASLTISPEIASQFVLAYVKQKPNTKILGIIPLHLLIYNLVNPEKAEEKKEERNNRIDERNKKKIAEGKKFKLDDKIKAKKAKKTFGEWLMSVGEPPVIFDSSLMNNSLKQIILFLNSKGYFECKVFDSVRVKKKKAEVFYIIRPGRPYKIDSVRYNCEDPSILPIIYADSANCLISRGENYDQDVFLKERDRITRYLNNHGYYAFAKEYAGFTVDTGIGGHRMNVEIDIRKFGGGDTIKQDSIIKMTHPLFHIRNVVIQMQYNPSSLNYVAGDTTIENGYLFVYPKGQFRFRPNRLLSKIFIKKGNIYRVSDVDYTYTGLTDLKTFRYINIKFVTVGDNMLDCYIQLMPTLRQSIGVESVGTNTGGDLGIQGDAIYQNKNLFRGSELFQLKLKGGLEAEGSQTTVTNGINRIIQLNTIDIGPEVDFSIPRAWVPFNLGANIDSTHITHHLGLWPKANPQTVFKGTFDYQDQPLNYERYILGGAYTFNFDPYEKKDLKKWNIELKFPEINYVHATLFPGFQNQLIKTNDFFLLNSFTNHLVPDIGLSVTNSNQVSNKQTRFHFLKMDLEESGYILRLFTPVFTKPFFTEPPQFKPDPDKSYLIAGVPYSYYVKGDIDYRQYFVLSKDDKIALRGFAGIGIPMAGVTQELPFDKSFWAGGANDLRGWQARALGPGGYQQTTIIDQIGDIKVEMNQEYRVNVIKFLGLGFFLDEGNVWLLNSNPAVPNGNFKWSGPDGFIHQVAIDGGIGLRLDFTYFIFRFDFGYPLLDPAEPQGHKLTTWHQLTISKVVPQYGIGYPF